MSNQSNVGKVWLDIRENATGEVVRHPEAWDFGDSDYIWSEGNFACDCNRADFFVQGKTGDARANAGDIPCSDNRYAVRLTDVAGAVVYQDGDWNE